MIIKMSFVVEVSEGVGRKKEEKGEGEGRGRWGGVDVG